MDPRLCVCVMLEGVGREREAGRVKCHFKLRLFSQLRSTLKGQNMVSSRLLEINLR